VINIKHHGLIQAKKVALFLQRSRPLPHVLHENVPYFSQWEARELNKQILDRSYAAEDVPSWKESGAKTKDEYVQWSWAGCGMACTKMFLAYRTGNIIPLVVLGKKCSEYGGYTLPLEDSNGLLYAPYAQFMQDEFRIRAVPSSHMLMQEIITELSNGRFVIASVNPAIRDPKSRPKKKGGHLILMLGYDLSNKEFYFHNPSGDTKENQEYATVAFADFKEFFSGRGVILE
jgi:hypothetical protein